MNVDAILSYHLNPNTCGVAKFNHALAKRLGVPCLSFAEGSNRPLVSVKFGELGTHVNLALTVDQTWDVFAHDWPIPTVFSYNLIKHARHVYAADRVIAEWLRPQRPDVITAHCPATVDGNPHRGSYRVLAFGMAHKLVYDEFRKLKSDLERDHPDYTLELSTGVHEGNPWDESIETTVREMRLIFGDKLRVLGFLADDALARTLQEVDAVAAFFVPALRANNTSAWAALEAGKFLYTNLDSQSPALDPKLYGWDALMEKLRA